MSLGALNLERPRPTAVSTVRINHKHCRDDFCSSFCATETLLTSGRLRTPEYGYHGPHVTKHIYVCLYISPGP